MRNSDVREIDQGLREILKRASGRLKVSKETEEEIELKGTIPVTQGRQQVDGHHFANTVTKPKDVRLYFFPIYTHPSAFSLSPELQKMLKGKSCFHIKHWSESVQAEINEMVSTGAEVYERDKLI